MTIDPWANALSADQRAYALMREANYVSLTSADRATFARLLEEAADAFEVAADAWEEDDDASKANIRRNLARQNRVEAFVASHPYVGYGVYMITDAEAEELARKNGLRLPHTKPKSKPAFHDRVRLGFAGPTVDLQQMDLKDIPRAFFTWPLEERLGSMNTRRPWIWTVGRVR